MGLDSQKLKRNQVQRGGGASVSDITDSVAHRKVPTPGFSMNEASGVSLVVLKAPAPLFP